MPKFSTPIEKRQEIFKAWVNGEDLEVRVKDDKWVSVTKLSSNRFKDDLSINFPFEKAEYRIKPKMKKVQRWILVIKRENCGEFMMMIESKAIANREKMYYLNRGEYAEVFPFEVEIPA